MPTRRSMACLLAAAVMVLGASGRVAGGQNAIKLDMSDRAVIARTAAYVARYQEQLTYVLADETTVQRRFDFTGAPAASRSTRSEVFFVFTPVEHLWQAVRQVIEVDGAPLANRRDMRALLNGQTVASVEAALRDENSRYNIGAVVRNFNEPTLSLAMFTPRFQAQFKFKRKATRQVEGRAVVTFEFTETDWPTIIRDGRGRSAPSTGQVSIDAVTGRVERAQLSVKAGTLRADLVTTYGPDDKLAMWVPVTFDETYKETSAVAAETIECRTQYSNYRRFEVNVIIR